MMRKKICGFMVLFLVMGAFQVFSFDWPQKEQVTAENFSLYFGQLRGETINTSLVFSGETNVYAADSGFLTVVIAEYEDDTCFFPSTLGNAVVIAHQDNLLTVYGNLDGKSFPPTIKDTTEISNGAELGRSGSSAWNEKDNALEFQVIDIKNNTAINPRILMPRISGKELPLYLSGIVLQGRNGRSYKIPEQSTIPAGFYRAYYRRQTTATPYKSYVSLNGNVVDEISFDILRQDGNLICASGKKNYPRAVLYPNDELILIGEVTFTHGKNSLQYYVTDILGKENVVTYTITNY